jgi:hypothetical protein
MVVPMLKLHPSSVEFPVESVVNGASTKAGFISVFVISFVQTYRSWLYDFFWMPNNIIKRYTLIFCSYILFTIDDITSCVLWHTCGCTRLVS